MCSQVYVAQVETCSNSVRHWYFPWMILISFLMHSTKRSHRCICKGKTYTSESRRRRSYCVSFVLLVDLICPVFIRYLLCNCMLIVPHAYCSSNTLICSIQIRQYKRTFRAPLCHTLVESSYAKLCHLRFISCIDNRRAQRCIINIRAQMNRSACIIKIDIG